MAKVKHLRDVYRFPGFVPLPKVQGIFGDPRAVVITLQRRRKKRAAVSVVRAVGPSTTNDRALSATSPVATSAFTFPARSAGSGAPGVAA
jgi:hypothetical protein